MAAILLATLPLMVLVGQRVLKDAAEAEARIDAELARSAASLSQALDNELAASFDVLAALAASGLVDAMRPGTQRGWLAQDQAQPRRSWNSTFLLDRQGALLADTAAVTASMAASSPVAGSPSPQLQDIHQKVLRRQSAVSGIADAGQPEAGLLALAVPVIEDGAIRYVLGARIDRAAWRRLAAGAGLPDAARAVFFNEQYQPVNPGTGAVNEAAAVFPSGVVDSMRSAPSGVHRSAGSNGKAVVAAWQLAPAAGWTVRVELPADALAAARRQALLLALGAGGATLLLGVLLALWLARRLSEPLQQLATDGPSRLQGRIAVREIAALRDALLQDALRHDLARKGLEATALELQALFAGCPIGLALAQDPACQVVSQNSAMDQLLGPVGSVISGATRVSHGGRTLAPGRQPLERAAALGESTWSQELAIVIAGRPSTFVLASAVPLRDANGQPRGAIMALVDISQRKQVEARLLAADRQLRESQQLMDAAQEAGQVGVFDYHFESDRMTWTPGHCKLFGIGALEGGGLQQWFARIDGADRGRIERDLWTACALRRERRTLDYRVSRPDGASRWLSSRLTLHYNDAGRAARMIGVSVDATDQKKSEDERVLQTGQAEAARQASENASRAKDEFLSLLGHELRNPLGAIAAASDVLEIAPPGGESALEARGIIARQTRNLASMINDIFALGQLITGGASLTRQSVDLKGIVERVVRTLQLTGEATRRELRLQLQDTWASGDPEWIEQVATQLLANVLKNTPPERGINVSTRPMQDWAVLEVNDHGRAEPAGSLPGIVDSFIQGEQASSRRTDGPGIGLTLVRRLVELHGGTLGVERSDRGNRFTVALPMAAAPAASGGTLLPPSRRRNVLVIEDNEDVLAALRSKLELDGHSVSTAADGIDGLSCLLQLRPEVSIVDIGLPGLTGFELARHARAAGYAGRMIAISGHGHERDVASALVAGFDAYLIKPVDRTQLRASLSVD